MQNKRQEQLLMILSERKDWITSRQLSSLLQVSDRTIRSDIDTINRQLTPVPIESNVRLGYRITEAYKPEQQEEESKELPETPGARCIYMIQKLLFEVKELNLVDLQSQIYISGYSIENDLKRIRKMLEPYANLKLVRNRECISLQGDETSKRRFYKDLLVAEIQENFLNLNRLAYLYSNFDLIEVKDIFVKVLEEYDYSIHESLFAMLILHAGTSIERMYSSNYVTMEEQFKGVEETIEYQISQSFFSRVTDRLHIRVQEGEVAMFALVIMGRRASNYTSDFVKLNGQWFHTKKLVFEGLEKLAEMFGLDFTKDDDLIAGLKMHLHGVIERLKNKVSLEDVFLEEIKRKYPLVFDMGICLAEYLEEHLKTRISDIECGFIALHLGAASERLNASRKYRAVMILPHNQSFSHMCRQKVLEMFGERIELLKTFYYFEEKAVRELAPDLILTTFPIEHKLNILTVSINLFVDTQTEASILQTLSQLNQQGFRLEFTSHIGKLVRKEHYYQNLDCKTPEEVIDVLCRDLEAEGIVESQFKEIVLQREEMSPTSFVNAFAIPHAFGAFARNSTIAVAQLKNPIRWGSFDIRLVMLFAINQGDQRMIKIFFDWVSQIVGKPEELAYLCSSCSYDQFIERM